jgi:glyoxylase-like metal-dependent hydrolase (beta-lactamase superfamily II)
VIYGSQESYEWSRSLYSDLLDEQNWEKLALKYYPETWDYAQAEEYMLRLRKFALRWWDPKRLGNPSQFRWIETQPLPEGLEAFVTSGHVPGHTSVIVHGADPRVVVAGDALLTRNHDEQVLTMIPHNREQSQRDRARILSLPGRILPGHDQEFSSTPAEAGASNA